MKRKLSARERQVVLLGGPLALLLVGWIYPAYILLPALRHLASSGQQIQAAREQLKMLEGVTEVKPLSTQVLPPSPATQAPSQQHLAGGNGTSLPAAASQIQVPPQPSPPQQELVAFAIQINFTSQNSLNKIAPGIPPPKTRK